MRVTHGGAMMLVTSIVLPYIKGDHHPFDGGGAMMLAIKVDSEMLEITLAVVGYTLGCCLQVYIGGRR